MALTNVSRRSFLSGAATVAAAGALYGGTAIAEEATAEQAGSSVPAWLGEEPGIGDADCSETLDTEVLVIGAGCSGYFAAVTAAEEGAKVVLVDCSETGFGIRSSALGAVGTELQKQTGVEIEHNDIVNDIVHYANGKCDARLWNNWADESGEAIDWYCHHVVDNNVAKVVLEWNMPTPKTRYQMWPTGHGTAPLGDSTNAEGDVQAYFINYLNSFDGCEFRPYNKLVKLVVEDGAVVGAYIATGENADGYARINASKGVVVATGGYVLNEDMMRALQPDTVAVSSGIFTMSQARGEGIKACLWAGAQMEDTHCSLIFDRGNIAPDVEVGNPWETGGRFYGFSSQPWLKVNIDGERFMNESAPYDYVAHAASKFRDHAWYPVWDDDFADDVVRFHTIGCSTQITRPGGDGAGRVPDGQTLAETYEASRQSVIDGVNQRIEDGLVVKADTLEELAEQLGIDAENFVATCERYNELYDAGNDKDFGKEPFRMSAMKKAPFYGMKMGGLLLCTYDGICVTPDCQAISTDGTPIEGLYVTGCDAGNCYNVTYPNFSAGLNAGRSATAGRHVGKLLAAK